MNKDLFELIDEKILNLNNINWDKNIPIWFSVSNSEYLIYIYSCLRSWIYTYDAESKFILFYFKDSNKNNKLYNKIKNISKKVIVIDIDLIELRENTSLITNKLWTNRIAFYANIRAHILLKLSRIYTDIIYLDSDSIFTNKISIIFDYLNKKKFKFSCVKVNNESKWEYKSGLMIIWNNKLNKNNLLYNSLIKYSNDVKKSVFNWGADQDNLSKLVKAFKDEYIQFPLDYFNWYGKSNTIIYTAKGSNKNSIVYKILLLILEISYLIKSKKSWILLSRIFFLIIQFKNLILGR